MLFLIKFLCDLEVWLSQIRLQYRRSGLKAIEKPHEYYSLNREVTREPLACWACWACWADFAHIRVVRIKAERAELAAYENSSLQTELRAVFVKILGVNSGESRDSGSARGKPGLACSSAYAPIRSFPSPVEFVEFSREKACLSLVINQISRQSHPTHEPTK